MSVQQPSVEMMKWALLMKICMNLYGWVVSLNYTTIVSIVIDDYDYEADFVVPRVGDYDDYNQVDDFWS